MLESPSLQGGNFGRDDLNGTVRESVRSKDTLNFPYLLKDSLQTNFVFLNSASNLSKLIRKVKSKVSLFVRKFFMSCLSPLTFIFQKVSNPLSSELNSDQRTLLLQLLNYDLTRMVMSSLMSLLNFTADSFNPSPTSLDSSHWEILNDSIFMEEVQIIIDCAFLQYSGILDFSRIVKSLMLLDHPSILVSLVLNTIFYFEEVSKERTYLVEGISVRK